jgi:hypothetical protein
MRLNARDQWLCAVLPAVITVGIYLVVAVRQDRHVLAPLRKQLRALGITANSLQTLEQVQAENRRLEAELRALSPDGKAPDPADRTGDADPAAAQTPALRQVTRLCEAGGITLLASAPDPDCRLPEMLQQALRPAAGSGHPPVPQIWRLELRGPYPAMVTLIESLPRGEPRVVPVGITMRPRTDDAQSIGWILTIWI